MWQLIIKTDDDAEYVVTEDLLDFDLTKNKDRKEIVDSIEETYKQALLESLGREE